MKTYILSVLGCVFLLDVLSALFPTGKTGKSVAFAFRVGSVLLTISPLYSIVNDFFQDLSSEKKELISYDLVEQAEELQIRSLLQDNFSCEGKIEKNEERWSLVFLKEAEGELDEEGIVKMLSTLYGKEVEIRYEGGK